DPPDQPGPRPATRPVAVAAQHQQPTPPSPDPSHLPPSDTSVRWAGQHIQPHIRHEVEPKPKLWITRLSNAEGGARPAPIRLSVDSRRCAEAARPPRRGWNARWEPRVKKT